jgi:protein TonB
MSESVSMAPPGDIDDPRARLFWIVPSALVIWLAVLIGFAFLLKENQSQRLEFKPLEARIVELPPELGGLSGGSGAPAAPAPARSQPISRPKRVAVHPAPKARPIPAPIVSPFGTAKKSEGAPAPPSSSGASSGGSAAGSGGAAGRSGVAGGSGSGGGLGSDDIGAHAIYSPTPEIPDELREDVFQAEAVAHFRVEYNGAAEVTLSQATSNERLNEIILETLRKWRFAPAIKGGVAIPSEFDLRIPIAVQ